MRNLVGGYSFVKRVAASVLIFILLGAQTVWADVIPNTGNFNTNTNVNTNGNITDITGGYVNGGTGFHHFSDFDIKNGQIVNQHFGDISRFVNLVDKQILINGIFNAIKGGRIDGNVVFVSPLGMIVGETGIVNVGSLQSLAPSRSAYADLLSDGIAGTLDWSKFSELDFNTEDNYSTEIYGKIFARNGVDLRHGKKIILASTADIVSGFNDNGFAKTSGVSIGADGSVTLSGVTFNREDIVKDNIVDAQFMDPANNGAIVIKGQEIGSDYGQGGLIQSMGDVNINGIRSDLEGKTIEIVNRVEAEGNINIGSTLTGENSDFSTDYINIYNDINSRGNININSELNFYQASGTNITALKDNGDTKSGDLNIVSKAVIIAGNNTVGNNIVYKGDFTQDEGSEIRGLGTGAITFNTNQTKLARVHNEGGLIDIKNVSKLDLNDTISTGEGGRIDITMQRDAELTQKAGITAIQTPGTLSLNVGRAGAGAADNALTVDVGGNITLVGGYNEGSVYLKGVNSDMNFGNITRLSSVDVKSDKAINFNNNVNVAGPMNFEATEGITQNSANINNTGNGNITFKNTGSGDISVKNVTASKGNVSITNSAADGDVNIDGNVTSNGNSLVISSKGDVNQSSNAKLTSKGTATLTSEGTLIADAINAAGNLTLSGSEVILNNLLSTTGGTITVTATDGSIIQTIATKSLDSAVGDIVLSATGGDIGTTDQNLMLNAGGKVSAKAKNIFIESPDKDIKFGDIIAGGDVALSTTTSGSITAGKISGANSLDINSAGSVSLTSGTLVTNTVQNDINITAANGISQDAKTKLASKSGNITINNTTTGNVSLNSIVASQGNVTVDNRGGNITANSTISAAGDNRISAKGNITQSGSGNYVGYKAGGSVYLTSDEGAIGSSNSYVVFENGASGSIYAAAQDLTNGSVFLKVLGKNMSIDGANILFGKDIGLASDKSVLLTGDLEAQNGGIYINSGELFSLENNLVAATIVDITSTGGMTQGEQSLISAVGNVNIRNSGAGHLTLNNITSSTGNISISNTSQTEGNVLFNGLLNAETGTISVTSRNDILKNSDTALLNGAGGITLSSTAGNIGSKDSFINVKSDNTVRVTASAPTTAEKGYIYLESTENSLKLGNVSSNKDVHVRTKGEDHALTTQGTVRGRDVYLDSENNVDVQNTVNSSRNVFITAGGDVTAGGAITAAETASIEAAGNVVLNSVLKSTSKNVEITAGDDVTINTEISTLKGDVNITAGNNINQDETLLSSINSGGNINLNAGNNIGAELSPIKLAAIGAVSAVATNGAVNITGVRGDISFGTVSAGTDIRLSAADGLLNLSEDLNAQNGLISLDSVKSMTLDKNITAKNNVTISASEGVEQTGGTVSSSDGEVRVTNRTSGGVVLNNISGHDVTVENLAANEDVNIAGVLNADTTDGTVTITSQRDILHTAENSLISAKSANLTAVGGSIGAKPPLGGSVKVNVDTIDATAGGGNIYIESPDHSLTLGTISANKEIDIKTTGTTGNLTVNNILDANTIALGAAEDIIINNILTATKDGEDGGTINLEAGRNIISGLVDTIVLNADSTVTLLSGNGNIGSNGSAIGVKTPENVIAQINSVSEQGGNIYLFSSDQDLKTGTITGHKTVSLEARNGALELNGAVSGADLVLNAAQGMLFNALASATDSIQATAGGDIKQSEGLEIALASGGTLVLNGTNIGESSQALKFTSGGVVDVTAATGLINVNSVDSDVTFGTVSAQTDIKLSSSDGTNGGNITLSNDLTTSNGVITIDSAKNLDVSKNITASGNVNISAKEGIDQTSGLVSSTGADVIVSNESGNITLNNVSGTNINVTNSGQNGITTVGGLNASGGDISVNDQGGNIVVSGVLNGSDITLAAANNITQSAADTFINATGTANLSSVFGNIGSSTQSLMINSANPVNASIAQNSANGGNIWLASENLTFNTGEITGYNTVSLNAVAGALVTQGTVSGGDVVLSALSTITTSDTINATGTLNANALDIAINSNVTAQDALLTATNTISNTGIVTVSNTLNANAQDITLNAGVSGGDVSFVASNNFINNAALTGTNSVTVQGSNIQINDLITGGTGGVSLTAANDIVQKTGLLKAVSSTGAISLEGANIGESTNKLNVSSPTAVNANATSGSVYLNGADDSVTFGKITAAKNIDLSSNGDININNDLSTSDGYIKIESANDLSLSKNISASQDITIIAGEVINQTAGEIRSTGGNVSVSNTTGNISLNNIYANAGNISVAANNGDITMAGIATAANDVTLSSVAGNIILAAAVESTGGNILVNAAKNITQTDDTQVGLKSAGTITLNAGENIGTADNKIGLQSGGMVDVTATTGSVNLNSVNYDISFGTISAGTNIDISSTGQDAGSISFTNDLNANGYINLDSSKNLDMSKNITAKKDISLAANDGITQGGQIHSTESGNISIVNKSTGDIVLKDVTANSGGISVENRAENGNIELTNVLNAGGNTGISLSTKNNISQTTATNSIVTGGPVSMTSESGNIGSATQAMMVSAGGAVSAVIAQDTGAGGNIYISSLNDPLTTGGIKGFGDIYLNAAGGDFTANGDISGRLVNIALAAAAIINGSITSESNIDIIAANGSITQGVDSVIKSTAGQYVNIKTSNGVIDLRGTVESSAGRVDITNNSIGGNSIAVNNVTSAGALNVINNDTGAVTVTGNLNSGADVTVSSKGGISQTNGSISSTSGNIDVSTTGGSIDLAGAINAENGTVSVVNNSTGTGSLTVTDVAAAGNINIENKADGLLSVNGTIDNAQTLTINASNTGANSGVRTNGTINNRGTVNITNKGGAGTVIGGTIYNNLVNEAALESSSVNVLNEAGALNIAGYILNGTDKNSLNSVLFENSGAGGLHFLSDSVIDNHGKLNFLNHAGQMTLYGTLKSRFMSDAEFNSESGPAENPDNDVIIGMKLENWGNVVNYKSEGQGSLILDENAVLSNFSVVDDGNVHTGIINLTNSGREGEAGGGIRIDGTINNGMLSDGSGTLVDNDGNIVPAGSIAAGGIVNIINNGTGIDGVDTADRTSSDFGILISDTAKINNYAEMNIENKNTTGNAKGSITISGTLGGDNGPILTGDSNNNDPSGAILNIKNESGGVEFTSTSSGDLKGSALNIENSGSSGVIVQNGASISNSADLTVNNTGSGKVQIIGTLAGGNTTVTSNNGGIDVSGSLSGNNNLIVKSLNSLSNITGSLTGGNISVNANEISLASGAIINAVESVIIETTSSAELGGAVSGNSVSVTSNGVNLTGSITGTDNVVINSIGALVDINGTVNGGDITIDGRGVNVKNTITGTKDVIIRGNGALVDAIAAISGANITVDGNGVNLANVAGTGNVSVNANDMALNGNGNISGVDIELKGNGVKLSSAVTGSGDVSVNANNSTLESTGSVSGATVDLRGAGVAVNNVQSTGALTVNSGSGNTSVNGTVNAGSVVVDTNGFELKNGAGITSDGLVDINATGTADIAGNISGNNVDIVADGIGLTGGISGDNTVSLNTSGNDFNVVGTVLGRNVSIDSGALTVGGSVIASEILGINTNNNNMTVSGTVSGGNSTLDVLGLEIQSGATVNGTELLDINAQNGAVTVAGNMNGGNIDILSNSTDISGSVKGSAVTVNTGAMNVSGSIEGSVVDLNTSSFSLANGAGVSGSTSVDVQSTSNADITGDLTGGNVTIGANTVNINGKVEADKKAEINSAGLTTVSGILSADDTVINTVGLNLNTLGSINGENSLDINSETGLVDLDGSVTGGNISIDGKGITFDKDIVSIGNVSLNTHGEHLTIDHAVRGDNITLTSVGLAVNSAVTATGDLTVNSQGALVEINNAIYGNNTVINSGALVANGSITGVNIDINATGDVDIRRQLTATENLAVDGASINISGNSKGQTVSMNSGSTVNLTGKVEGNDITITSVDSTSVSNTVEALQNLTINSNGLDLASTGSLSGSTSVNINSENGLVDLGGKVSGGVINIDGSGVNVKDTITGTNTVSVNAGNKALDIDANISGSGVSLKSNSMDIANGLTINANNSTLTADSGTGTFVSGAELLGRDISIIANGATINGNVSATNAVDITSSALVSAIGDITGNTVNIQGNGVNVSNVTSNNALNINALNNKTVLSGKLDGKDIKIDTTGLDMNTGSSIIAGNVVDINSAGGKVNTTGTISGSNVYIDAQGIDVNGTITASGENAGVVTIDAKNGASVVNGTIQGTDVSLTSGSLDISRSAMISADNKADIISSADTSVSGKISAKDVSISAKDLDVKVLGNIDGTDSVNASAANSMNVDGVIHGNNVTVSSGAGGLKLAHNKTTGNIIADNNLTVTVSDNGSIINGSANGINPIASSVALIAGGDMSLSAANIGVIDQSVSNIINNGFVLDSSRNSIHLKADGSLSANASSDVNIRETGSGLNISELTAGNALLYAVNGAIDAEKINTTGNLYMLANSNGASIDVASLSTGGKLLGESSGNINLNSISSLNVDSLFSKNGSINIVSDGNTYINEIAAPENIDIKVNDEKLDIVNLGRIQRDTSVIPKNVSLTVLDAKRPHTGSITNSSTPDDYKNIAPNSKLNILNAYVRDKATLRADTITAQVYDTVTGQKRENATGFHNANQDGKLLVLDVQGANYVQEETKDSLNPKYVYDPDDKHALDVNITIGESVDDAVFGAHFDKLYSDYAHIDAVNETSPESVANLEFDSIITAKQAVFRNNKYRIDTKNIDTTYVSGIDKHYNDSTDRTIRTTASYNLDMNDKINVGPIPDTPDPPDPPGPDIPDPPGPDIPDNPDNPDKPVPPKPWEPDYNPDERPSYDPNNPTYHPQPEAGGGKYMNPLRSEHTTSVDKFGASDSNAAAPNPSPTATTIDKPNEIALSGAALSDSDVQWVIKDKFGNVLGASSQASENVITSIEKLSKEGMDVRLTNGISKGREVEVSFKCDNIPYTVEGKVKNANKKLAYIKFNISYKSTIKQIILMLRSKLSNIDNL